MSEPDDWSPDEPDLRERDEVAHLDWTVRHLASHLRRMIGRQDEVERAHMLLTHLRCMLRKGGDLPSPTPEQVDGLLRALVYARACTAGVLVPALGPINLALFETVAAAVVLWGDSDEARRARAPEAVADVPDGIDGLRSFLNISRRAAVRRVRTVAAILDHARRAA